MTKYILKSTKYILKSTKYILKSTKYILKSTKYILKSTKYILKSTKLDNFVCGILLHNLCLDLIYINSSKKVLQFKFD